MGAPEIPETVEDRERLLSPFRPHERKLIEDVLADYPTLTVAKAIEILRAFGGL
jgi:hypothetical protein